MIEYERTRDTLEAVGLLFCAQNLDAHLEKAVRETPTYITFLCQLLDAESEARKQRSEETRLKLSRLPQKKTLADSDFSFQPGLDERLIRELETLQFIHNHENVVLLGPPGVGNYRKIYIMENLIIP